MENVTNMGREAQTVGEENISEPKQENATKEKEWTFRPLGAPDVFLMFKILGKIGIKEFAATFEDEGIKDMILSGEKNGTKDLASIVGVSVGLQIVDIVLNNLPKAEQEIYQMLSNVSGMTVEEISSDAVRFMEMTVDFVKKPEFKDFIKVASKLF